MRILAVDPGEKRIGIAISDPSGIVANPLTIVNHISRVIDAAVLVTIAQENSVEVIIIGQALDDLGLPTPQSRRADKLAEAIRKQCDIPISMWDESGSTQIARQVRIEMGIKRNKRRGHIDDLAATIILQSYLDHLNNQSSQLTYAETN